MNAINYGWTERRVYFSFFLFPYFHLKHWIMFSVLLFAFFLLNSFTFQQLFIFNCPESTAFCSSVLFRFFLVQHLTLILTSKYPISIFYFLFSLAFAHFYSTTWLMRAFTNAAIDNNKTIFCWNLFITIFVSTASHKWN